MLVVADQRARRIGRQRRLAGARQAEEHRRVAGRPDIGRAVHRHHALLRQQVVERGEHRLLHLAGIGGAADQHDHAGEVDGDHRLAQRAVAGRIGPKRRQVDDRHLGHEALELVRLRPDQQVADEQRMPGIFGDDARAQAVIAVGAADQILDEQVARRQHARGNRRAARRNAPATSARLLSHQTLDAVNASRTMYLSFGERPVWLPVSAASAPWAVSRASPRRIACSVSAAAAEIVVDAARCRETGGNYSAGRIALSGLVHALPLLRLPADRARRRRWPGPRAYHPQNRNIVWISNH